RCHCPQIRNGQGRVNGSKWPEDRVCLHWPAYPGVTITLRDCYIMLNFFADCKLIRGFTTVYRLRLLLCAVLCILGQFAVAQTTIEGIVFDTHTKQRISQVYVYNTANDNGGYNNTRGEFTIDASAGDILIAAAKGYYPDTLVVSDKKVVLFNMTRS